MTAAPPAAADLVAGLESRGYVVVPEHGGIRAGARVRHYGEQYPRAVRHGTATVVAVMRRHKSAWAASTGQPDVEVVVQRDDRERGSQAWADHATVLAKPCEGAC